MSKHEFEFLELEERINLILGGTFIKSIEFENRTTSLYLINKEFYVEVFSEENSKQIASVTIASKERLYLYLNTNNLLN